MKPYITTISKPSIDWPADSKGNVSPPEPIHPEGPNVWDLFAVTSVSRNGYVYLVWTWKRILVL
jgi:hypothetical protein